MQGNNSILETVKKSRGIMPENTDFDDVLIMHINTAFAILTQLGVGPEEGFAIDGPDAVWTDFVEDLTKLEPIKSYISMKVYQMFDPPTNSTTLQSLERVISELEWRINITVDPPEKGEEGS